VIGTLTITAGENLIFYDLNFGISERPHQQDVPGLTRPEKPMTELRVRRYAIVERCSSSMIKTPTLSTTRVRKNLNQSQYTNMKDVIFHPALYVFLKQIVQSQGSF
jgi:hypothetical protein